ncbi:hypothetical protein [Rhizobium sp. NPDC090279]|uniref:hypothetical protein n=1 Tax=Rhizobium sp. NPDC090279 TaxID=3364499 RepID=UPI00383A309C
MTTKLQPDSSKISGMADKRLKIFDSLGTFQALFVSTLPRLKDGGHERYEVFRRTAARAGAMRYEMPSHVSGKPSEIQKVFHKPFAFAAANIPGSEQMATGRGSCFIRNAASKIVLARFDC